MRLRPAKPRPAEPTALRPRHELTLISIVQGVALYFLTDSSRTVLVELRVESLPYVVSGLLMILTVWARSMLHAFTVIRWPLELGHNFFYIFVTLVEATLFTQVSNPARWFPMSFVLAFVFWVMFAYERRMYRLRRADSAGPRGAELIDVLERDHLLSLRVLVPLMLVSWGASAALVVAYPDTFITQHWHVALGLVQALGLLGYLALVWRFYGSIAPLVVAARSEWDA